MKYLVIFCLSAVLLASCGGSRRIANFTPGLLDSLKRTSVDLAEYEKKYGKYDGVFLVSEQTTEYATTSMWNCYKMRTLKYLVLNPDAEWLGTFNMDLPPGGSLSDVRIQILHPDGTTQEFSKADLKEEKTSEYSSTYKLAYPGIRKGSIVQESYEMRVPLISLASQKQDVPLQYAVPCERLIYQYIIPDSWEIKLKEIAEGKIVPYNRINNSAYDKIILSYDMANIPAVPDEPYSPYFKEIGNYVEMMVTRYDLGPGASDVEMLKDWDEFADEFTDIAVNNSSFWSNTMEKVVDDLVATSPSPLQKLDTIVRYVQKNVKWGSSSRDDTFADVLKKGEGSPHMIAGLTRAMLEEAGLQADYLLVHSREDGYFDKNYIDFQQLAIPAVGTRIDGKDYVVFPYIPNLPVDLIPEHFQGQTALKVNADGFAGFTTLPLGESAENLIDENYTLTIDEEGMLTVEEEKILRGPNAYWARRALGDLKDEELRKELKSSLAYSEGDVELKSHQLENLADYKKPLVIRTRYTIDNLVTVTPDEVIFQTGGLLSPATSRKTKVVTEDRETPIRIYYPEQLNKKITINHPASWNLETRLAPVDRSTTFGAIRGTYQVSNGQVVVEHHRSLNRASEPKEKADELLAVIGSKSQLNIPSLVFKVQ